MVKAPNSEDAVGKALRVGDWVVILDENTAGWYHCHDDQGTRGYLRTGDVAPQRLGGP
jgi:hypothetical protein